MATTRTPRAPLARATWLGRWAATVLLGAAAGGAIGVPFGSSVAAAADGANLDANAVPPPEGAAATTYPCPSADAIVEVLGVEMTLEAHDETMLSGTVCDYEAAECDFCLPFVSLVYQPAGLVGEFGEGEEQDGVGDRAVWGTFGDILWVWVGENFVSVWVDLEGDEGARDEVLAIADVAIEPLDGFEAPEFEAPVAAEVALDSCPEPGLIGEAVGIELELEEFPGDGILSCGYTGETADEVFDVVVQFLPFVSFEDLLAEDPSYAGDVDAGLVEEISGLGDHAIWDATVECEEALGVWSDELFMQVTVFDDCAALDDAIAVAEAVLG